MTNERINHEPGCIPISVRVAPSGDIQFREMRVSLLGQEYFINVATPSYIAELREHNAQFPLELKIDDRALILDSVDPVEHVCRQIKVTPFEELKDLLTPINPESNPTGS